VRVRYNLLLAELKFKVRDGETITRRAACLACGVPVAFIVGRRRHGRINVDGSLHWQTCAGRVQP
jgi:hypothetical protein